jgi:hypothetical protein
MESLTISWLVTSLAPTFSVDDDISGSISPAALDAATQTVERGLFADGPDARYFGEGCHLGRNGLSKTLGR